MPQIQQLPFIYASQIFWLLLVFGTIFFVIGRGMLPKIQATVEARTRRIADDLAGAERARGEAAAVEAAYRARIEESRIEAHRVTETSKRETGRDAEARIKAADAEIRAHSQAAEAEIRAAFDKAMRDVEKAASEIAQDMVAKLAGVTVGKDRAAEAVKATLNG
ncbi:MAG TPA: ATPase [Allosphingosinicella sp.]|nr:ATPase [Allosphingosinicella sp.]